MKKNAVCFLGMLALAAPLVFGAESSVLDSSGGSGTQKDPFSITFRPSTELSSKPATVFLEKGERSELAELASDLL